MAHKLGGLDRHPRGQVFRMDAPPMQIELTPKTRRPEAIKAREAMV
jgi:hypothetical protein